MADELMNSLLNDSVITESNEPDEPTGPSMVDSGEPISGEINIEEVEEAEDVQPIESHHISVKVINEHRFYSILSRNNSLCNEIAEYSHNLSQLTQAEILSQIIDPYRMVAIDKEYSGLSRDVYVEEVDNHLVIYNRQELEEKYELSMLNAKEEDLFSRQLFILDREAGLSTFRNGAEVRNPGLVVCSDRDFTPSDSIAAIYFSRVFVIRPDTWQRFRSARQLLLTFAQVKTGNWEEPVVSVKQLPGPIVKMLSLTSGDVS